MGKKSKLKAIRKIASTMPVINTRHIQGETITGAQAMKEGVTEIDGKPIDQFSRLIKKTAVAQPINHNRKMKKLYNRHGAKAVSEYISAVAHYQAMAQIKEEMNKTKEEGGA